MVMVNWAPSPCLPVSSTVQPCTSHIFLISVCAPKSRSILDKIDEIFSEYFILDDKEKKFIKDFDIGFRKKDYVAPARFSNPVKYRPRALKQALENRKKGVVWEMSPLYTNLVLSAWNFQSEVSILIRKVVGGRLPQVFFEFGLSVIECESCVFTVQS